MRVRAETLALAALLVTTGGCDSSGKARQESAGSNEVERLFLADQADRSPPADGHELTH